jgi:hypothetical protein
MTTDVKKRSSKRPIYFHIGQAKAASTFLQKNIFEPHPEIHHLFSRHFKKEFIDFTDHCYGGGEEDFKAFNISVSHRFVTRIAGNSF